MKILAFDTSAKTASVAVCEDGKLLGASNVENGLTQSELILPMAEALLKQLKLGFGDMELYAVFFLRFFIDIDLPANTAGVTASVCNATKLSIIFRCKELHFFSPLFFYYYIKQRNLSQ